MKVIDLIERLQEMDPGLDVVLGTDENYGCVECVVERTLYERKEDYNNQRYAVEDAYAVVRADVYHLNSRHPVALLVARY